MLGFEKADLAGDVFKPHYARAFLARAFLR